MAISKTLYFEKQAESENIKFINFSVPIKHFYHTVEGVNAKRCTFFTADFIVIRNECSPFGEL